MSSQPELKRRRFLKPIVILIAALFVAAAAATLFMSPLARDRNYAHLNRYWEDRWPLERGRYLPTRFLPLFERTGIIQRVTYRVEPGIAYVLDPRDVIESALLDKGTWDDEVWSMVAGHLKPGATLIDVGAHIGTFSIPGAKAVGASGRVVAIEPNPVTAAKLNANIAASGSPNILVEAVACGAAKGTLPLFIGSKINSGTSSLAKTNAVDHGARGDSVDVPIERLDDIVKRAGLTRIDAIKIDVEGAETGVIKGGEMSIRTFHPVIILEVVNEMLKNMGSSKAELESVLRSYGYVKIRENSTRDNAEWSPAPAVTRLNPQVTPLVTGR